MTRRRMNHYRCECGSDLPGQCPGPAQCPYSDMNTQDEDDWHPVVLAADCDPCPDCGEPVCPHCDDHYADCDCPGPTQDGYEYRMRGARLEARQEHGE